MNRNRKLWNLDPRKYRRDPSKPALSVAELAPRTMSEMDRWRTIVSNDRELVAHVRTNHRTMRLAKVLPLWSNFIMTTYFGVMRQHLSPTQIRKYKAWWEMILDITEHRKDDSAAFRYAYSVLLAEKMRRAGGPRQTLRPEKFGLSEGRAAFAAEAVLTRFENLTLG